MGHKDIRMTQRYAHHCPESLRDGVQILEVGHNLVTVEGKQKCVECLKTLEITGGAERIRTPDILNDIYCKGYLPFCLLFSIAWFCWKFLSIRGNIFVGKINILVADLLNAH